MFNYSLSNLFTILPRPFKLNVTERDQDAEIQVLVTIKQWDPTGVRDRKQFLAWLDVGCRQMSDGHYKIEVVTPISG